MYDTKAMGARVRQLRKQFGCSREEIAGRIGRSSKYYADIERGSCGMSLNTFLELANLYEVSLDYLIYGKEKEQGEMNNRNTNRQKVVK
ncbi:MAG: helix-turn-helix domain-containing protein [Acetatifactor sp.]|nr:helix-turn-helix domain-containing protein [Acetatifactor sp.]